MTQSYAAHEPVNGYILVAEDDHIAQLVVKKILEQAGYTADLVADGKEAICALQSKHYDLIVMDCFMPRMDGFEATRMIRTTVSGRINPGIPIIALTGLSAKEDKSLCLDAGMDRYVSKPVDPQTLIAAIEQCLGKAAPTKSASGQDEMQTQQIGGDGFMDTIIENFLAEVPRVISGLQQAVKRGDVVELQNIGHRLRGATGILEAATLSARSQALEQAGKDGNLTLARSCAAELIKGLQELEAAMTE